jgi:hypothetical protein
MAKLRELLGQYAVAALWTAGLTVLGIIGSLLLNYDRREPFLYAKVTLSPIPAKAGQAILVRREIVWLRHCEREGEVWREIVRPNGTISQYDRRYTRVPSDLGLQIVENPFWLDAAVLDNAENEGTALFRLSVIFHHCGITSGFRPIHGPRLEIPFRVVRP